MKTPQSLAAAEGISYSPNARSPPISKYLLGIRSVPSSARHMLYPVFQSTRNAVPASNA